MYTAGNAREEIASIGQLFDLAIPSVVTYARYAEDLADSFLDYCSETGRRRLIY